MDDKQKLMIRNIGGAVMLLVLLLVVLAWCGVFEGARSDEAQVRALMERAKEEFNDRDWQRLVDLSNMSSEDKRAWIEAVPDNARLVRIDAIEPVGMVNVPPGATEYELEVVVAGRPIIGNIQFDSVRGQMYFVKEDGRWFIDWNRSAPTFPYVPQPKRDQR